MEGNVKTHHLIVENKNSFCFIFLAKAVPPNIECLSPPSGLSNVLHCPRTLGETFKRKVEHFNTLQKVLAIAGRKCTPLKNGQTFILQISQRSG